MTLESVAEPSSADRNRRIQKASDARSLANAESELHYLGLDPECVTANNESHIHVLSAYATRRILEFAREKLSTINTQNSQGGTTLDPRQLTFNYDQNIDS